MHSELAEMDVDQLFVVDRVRDIGLPWRFEGGAGFSKKRHDLALSKHATPNVQRHPRWAPADQWLSGTPGAPAGGWTLLFGRSCVVAPLIFVDRAPLPTPRPYR